MNAKALIQLWNLTQEHAGTSGARAAAGVLLALYNGTRFPCDLTDLRLLDSQNLSAAITVISDDAHRCQMEIHEWLNRITGRTDFGTRFEHLSHEYTIFKRGRCKKNDLRPLQPTRLKITTNPDSSRENARSAKSALSFSLLNTTINAHPTI